MVWWEKKKPGLQTDRRILGEGELKASHYSPVTMRNTTMMNSRISGESGGRGSTKVAVRHTAWEKGGGKEPSALNCRERKGFEYG